MISMVGKAAASDVAKTYKKSGASLHAAVGVNIGGWLVLEPWITPSLFYRFLGRTVDEGVGLDSYTFCEALGPNEGNRVLQAHWDSWLTEEHIAALADRDVEMLRLPLGDWTVRPYGPYEGCMAGSDRRVDWLLDMADKYDLKVLLDLHGVRDSQNGFDTSGRAARIQWVAPDRYVHDNIGEWMGTWTGEEYFPINHDNIQWTIETVDSLVDRWGGHPAVVGVTPLNEPGWESDLTILKDFYRQVRRNMREK